MDKDLDLDGAVAADIGDLLPAQLPGQDHPAHAHGRGPQDAVQGVDRHLGGGVEGNLRRHLTQQGDQTEILHNKGVHAGTDGCSDGLGSLLQLPVGHQGVQRQMNLNAPDMAITHGVRQLVQGKVLGVLSGVERAGAQIDGIGAALNRRTEGIHGTGGRKQFQHIKSLTGGSYHSSGVLL